MNAIINKKLSEKAVLRKLDINDFTQLTTDKLIEVSSLINDMKPEVAQKVLEQFPDFATAAKDTLSGYQSTLENVISANSESDKAYAENCAILINLCKQELEKNDLSPEERRYILELIYKINENLKEVNTDSKRFNLATSCLSLFGVVCVLKTLASVLGSNTKISSGKH